MNSSTQSHPCLRKAKTNSYTYVWRSPLCVPCYKLQLKFNRYDVTKRFAASGRSGFYFSVIKPGEVSAGSHIEILSRDANQVTVADLNSLVLGQTRDLNLMRRAANIDVLPDYWKMKLRQRAEMASTAFV
jgi:MOSC domain-containing protein YiiM